MAMIPKRPLFCRDETENLGDLAGSLVRTA
jgi:hypothetical protein